MLSLKSTFHVCVAVVGVCSGVWGADYTVINTNNSGAGSLRQAIVDANANPGPDRIAFEIPGSGMQVIRLTTALPTNAGPVEIDGFTQPGSSPNTLPDADNGVRLIQLDGGNSAFDGLVLGGGNSVLRGLSLRRFNVGVRVESSTNLVAGNLVGSELPGVTNGNVVGVIVSSGCCSVLGGTNAADRNIIAGNNGNSIRIGEFRASPARDNRVLGNFVGVLSSGNAASVYWGSSGISLRESVNSVIGGLEPGARNIIAAGQGGVSVYGPATNTFIMGNYIGVGVDGVTMLFPGIGGVSARDGLGLGNGNGIYPQTIRVEGNRIANCSSGVSVQEPIFDPSPVVSSRRVTITRNAIFLNRGAGIYLSEFAQTNDFLDLDTGANNRQNYPEISSVVFEDGDTIVTGVLYSALAASFRIEFFANAAPHSSGFGEGEFYLGFTNVATDFNGTASYQITFPGVLLSRSYITATATDANGNTSMFSRPRQGPQPAVLLPPTNTFVVPGANVTFSVQAGGMSPISYQWLRDGAPLPDATNSSVTFTNVDWPQRGQYSVLLSNAFGVVESAPATLFVKIRPTILYHPVSQNVVTGGTVVLSVGVTNTTGVPLGFYWRSNSTIIATEVSMRRQAFLTVSNIRANANYSVIASNEFGPPGVLSTRASLTVLADTDGDGLPDAFEEAYLLDASNPGDAALDADEDGVSNADEYASGTDPRDPANQLRVETILGDAGIVSIGFNARSNKTYAVQFREALDNSGWQFLASVPARESNHVAQVTDPVSNSRRFYRLVTPVQP